jgi:hypothetical protein
MIRMSNATIGAESLGGWQNAHRHHIGTTVAEYGGEVSMPASVAHICAAVESNRYYVLKGPII